jgi:ankyrin repeat protein
MIQRHARRLLIAILLLYNISMSPALESLDTKPTELNVRQVNKAATDAQSLFLDDAGRIQAADTFQRLVRIKSPSGQEQQIREEVQRMLAEAGAVVVHTKSNDREAPYNLIMEIPGSEDLVGQPGILLNAHLDTIGYSTPEFLAFDDSNGDFYHQHEMEPGKRASFGADDRAGVGVIVETVRHLQANYWSRRVPHRRILLVFTAEEERGCVGASYLSRYEPDLFANLDITLSIDGWLDQKSDYPRDSFVAVVSESNSTIAPYKHVLELIREFCGRSGFRFGKTEIGLGAGDFAQFPSSALAGLHLRGAMRGSHRRERVNVQDLINQIDLLCYILLNWDHSLPLQEAAARGNISTVKSLIEKGAEIDEREEIFLRTALHRAVTAGNKEVVELLLSYGANPNARDSRGYTALHYAAINDNKKMVELLITKGADIKVKDASGNTPLYIALRSGHKNIADMLLGKGAELSIHVAAILGNIEAIKSFVETGTSIDIIDSRGFTPLHYAVIERQYDAVKFLVAEGANVNVEEIWPFGTPLHFAVENGDKEIVELLAAAGADVNARRRRPAGDSPLHSAIKGSYNDIISILASHGADLNMKDNSGQIPLDIAISQKRRDIVRLLLAKGAKVPSIHTAAKTGSVEAITEFLKKGANINEKDSSGLTPLHIATSGDSKEVAEFLLAKGADVNAKDNGGYTPLNYVIWNRNKNEVTLQVDMVELLLEKGADTNVRSLSLGYTSLHWAILMWNQELIELLMAAGADVNAKAKAGETPLDVAAYQGPTAIGELLLKKGAEISSLQAAAFVGDLAKVRAFINNGIDVNSKNAMTKGTALHSAAAADRKEIVEFLINCGSDVDIKDKMGRTALDLAKENVHTEIVELLRKHGAKE